MKTTTLLIALNACLAGLNVQTAYAAPKPTITAGPTLPEIWKNVPAAQRLQYVRAAELDATRILAERIAGIKLDGETTVKDLCAASDTVKGQLAASLKGVHTTEGPTFCDDGRVEVVRAVKVKNLIESIKTQTVNGKKVGATATLLTETEEIDALGNAAIKGSVGHGRVKAKRAAEMDLYRKLAERIAGVQITSDSTMKDFAVEDDAIRASLCNVLKSAEMTGITYTDDTASVTAKVKVGPLVRTIVRTKSASGKVLKVDEKVEQMEIEETGSGAASAAPAATDDTAATASEPTTEEVDTILSEVLGSDTTL